MCQPSHTGQSPLLNALHPPRGPEPTTPENDSLSSAAISAPKGIRIPVAALKGLCPSPLDDGGLFTCCAALFYPKKTICQISAY
jgi:hypothetical protein